SRNRKPRQGRRLGGEMSLVTIGNEGSSPGRSRPIGRTVDHASVQKSSAPSSVAQETRSISLTSIQPQANCETTARTTHQAGENGRIRARNASIRPAGTAGKFSQRKALKAALPALSKN